MPDLSTFALFLLACLILSITPGPGMIYVITRSVGQNRKAGIISALGTGVGTGAHTLAVAFGLSALLLAVPFAFELVKFAGALYLIYLGLRTILSKDTTTSVGQLKTQGFGHIFGEGVLSTVLNPKVALFFLAFLPQFVNQNSGSVTWQILFYGFIIAVFCTLVNILVALLASYATGWLKGRSRFSKAQRWFTGGIFVVLGTQIAFTQRS